MYRVLSLGFLAISVLAPLALSPYEVIVDQKTLEVLTPTLSKQTQAKIQLDNGLRALIISDPELTKAATALCVHVGSWNDPSDLPGLAHFLEHMLFMGTEKYRDEDEYSRFIKDHAGIYNAFTASDRTVYGFDIDPTGFEGALDRFSHFFIDPLLDKSSVGRELHAIDQEHAKNIENDGRSAYMVLKEMCKKSHPMSSFSTGNLETLHAVPIERLRAWYEEYYTPDAMTLVVSSPLPLEESVELIDSLFSQIPLRSVLFPPKYQESMFKADAFGSEVLINAKQHSQTISVLWEVPMAIDDLLHTRAFDLISYALTRKTPKSLYEHLKSQGLVEDISAGLFHLAHEEALFEVEFTLTQKGIQQREQVLRSLFLSFAQLNKKVPTHLLNELAMVTKLNYQYQENPDPFSSVMALARSTDKESFATFPEQMSLFLPISTTLITESLQSLTPQKMIVQVLSDQFPKQTYTQEERWTNTHYTIKKFSPEFLKSLSESSSSSSIDLTAINPFIPTHVPAPVSRESQWKTIEPKLINSKKEALLYFAEDKYFGIPKMHLTLGIRSTALDGTPKSIVATDLLLLSFLHENAHYIDAASYAGITSEFSLNRFAIECSFEGYVEKTPLLINELLTNLKSFWVSKEHFDLYKEQLLKNYKQAGVSSPLKLAMDQSLNVFVNDAPLPSEKILSLENLSHEEFLLFCNKFFKKHIFEGVVYGALDEQKALTLSKDLQSILNPKPLESSELQRRSFLVLPEGRGPYLVKSESPLLGHSLLLAIEAGPYTFTRRSFHQILSKCLSTAFFDSLRTKQQTGYIVASFDRVLEHNLLQYFAVQSNTHHPAELLARFELFLEDFVRNLDERLPLNRFEAIKSALIQELSAPPKSFYDAASALYRLAFEEKGDFLLLEKRIAALKEARYEDLKFHASEMLSRKNSRRIAVSIQGKLPKDNEFRYQKVQRDDLRQLGMLVFDD